MRALTDNEKEIAKKLNEFYSKGNSIKLGELLRRIFPIDCIEQNQKEDDFYKKTVTVCYDSAHTNIEDIYEAINLFVLLIQKDYLVVKDFVPANIIGEKNYMPFLLSEGKHVVETRMFNYYKFDLWELLCSNYYVTASLTDFIKDFKTVEQRRHEEQLKEAKASVCWSRLACIISIATLFMTICCDCFQQKLPSTLDEEQFKTLREDIKNLRIVTPIQTEIKSPIKVEIQSPQKIELGDTIKIRNVK
jgi:hypothetical protein